ncbi:MAG: hypothetical protein ACOY81_05815 [Bacillota bacterium]|nr:hypothetical protein [Desulfurispora thermophila]
MAEKKTTPDIAPGNYAELEKSASEEDRRKGNYTRVTRLSYDEVDTT